MQLLSPSPLVDLSYRPDLHILVMRWLNTVEEAEAKRIYQAVEVTAEDQECRFWLIDARRRPSFNATVTQWVFEELAPNVVGRFGGPLHFSYLVSPEHLAGAQEFLRTHVTPHRAALPYRLHYATDEGTATQWLVQAQTVPTAQ
ncbi:hypothetical protein [Hymenobacter cellulosivorans]|uniref:STAS/SEC14 domain-containing protein n=1 Tax=Hymenobacter cellulosivorans TaxID=2932249 RepID=A0ABY4FGC2_9BACT|nr:hypothetical protein [Hymenobacter cellulosivorans]UOQ55007.1 hypothetical protein MUN80_09675 [Hymenobacter cellulosivorans]